MNNKLLFIYYDANKHLHEQQKKKISDFFDLFITFCSIRSLAGSTTTALMLD